MATPTNTVFFPVVINAGTQTPAGFVEEYHQKKDEWEQLLLETGAVKFTGIDIRSTADFQQVTDGISSEFLDYIDGNSPRTRLTGHVYTSTEFDSTQRITMHNELSYSAKWPGKIFFSCLVPATTGGETLLADSSAIYEAMDRTIVHEIEKNGIQYIRNLHGGKGIGPSWQETFETTSKEQLEHYCTEYGINFEWNQNGGLKLRQFSKGIIPHRVTGRKLWFNQVDQFHPCHLDDELYETLQLLYDSPEQFPMFVTFGNGQPIPETMIGEMLATIDALTIAPVWQTGELLMLDNERIAHGRNPFTGNRKVLVAMSE
ncbi:MAG: TauD/TfdA family dioxygenase [Dinghuibacter sp.]|nr:TauD/TfdA family dioxygenase [Dinghuibacter sp.]